MHKNALLSTFGQANQLNKLMMRFSIYAIAQKGANASLKATESSSLHFKGRCTINGGGSPKISSNKMTHKGFLPAFQVSMLLMNLCIDGTPGGFSQPTEDDNMRCQRVTQVCHLAGGVYKRRAICCRSSCKWLFQVRPFATVYFTFLAFQCCQMLSKKQLWQWPLTFEKKKRVYPNWPNIATKFARRGTMRSLLLSNWSSWRRAASAMQWTKFDRNPENSTSPGESCARLPAGLRLHRNWWLCWSTWSAQERGLWWYTGAGEDGISKEIMPSKPQSSKIFAFVGGRPDYHLGGAKCKISYKPRKVLAW